MFPSTKSDTESANDRRTKDAEKVSSVSNLKGRTTGQSQARRYAEKSHRAAASWYKKLQKKNIIRQYNFCEVHRFERTYPVAVYKSLI